MAGSIVKCDNCGTILDEERKEDRCFQCGHFYTEGAHSFINIYKAYCNDNKHYCSKECLKNDLEKNNIDRDIVEEIINNSETTMRIVAERL